MNNMTRCITIGFALAFAAPALAEGSKIISSKAEFLEKIAGKKLWINRDNVTTRQERELLEMGNQ